MPTRTLPSDRISVCSALSERNNLMMEFLTLLTLSLTLLLETTFAKQDRRQSGTFAITGVNANGVQPRLELRTLQQNADQWNLYLLSLINFQAMNQNSSLSYYQIAGIHGLPNVPWDGVQGNPTAMSEGAVGYCPHSSNLFPTWHRVYLALYEQAFYSVVQSTVSSFPSSQQSRWAAAAATLRIPYWDWAVEPPSGQNNIPSAITNPSVTLTTPTGTQTFANPLLAYAFHPLDSSGFLFQPWNYWSSTLRYPTSEAQNASPQENQVIAATNNNRLAYRQRIYNIFTAYRNFSEFSNEAWEASSTLSNKDSLESIHDSLHADLGGYNDGHMAFLWWAAFDPVFWLHHTNVDRMIALWQAIYTHGWVVQEISNITTYTIANLTKQGPHSPLTPFHKDTTGTPWTSSEIKNWTMFGYTYPEFISTDGSASAIKNVINSLYGPSAQSASKREVPIGSPHVDLAYSKISNSQGQRHQYITNIVADRMGLNGSFTVYIFLNDVPDDPLDWATTRSLVGSHSFISNPHPVGHSMGEMLTSGTVPLTDSLAQEIAAGNLANLDKSSVVPFLTSQLHWRVALGRYPVDPAIVPKLEVSVVSALLSPAPSSYEFPTWSDYELLAEITADKPGSVRLS